MKKILILILVSLLSCLSLSANAGRVINSVLLNGSATTIVTGGSTVTVTMQVTTSGNGANNRWKSTSYTLDGSTICVNTADKSGSGTYTNNFDITAPSADGNYSVSFYAHRNNGCSPGNDSNNFSVDDAIVVGVPSCEVLFPGDNPFGTITSLNSDSEFKDSSQCNGSKCKKNDVEDVANARLPTIPTGGSNLGKFNRGSLSDTDYNFYNGWNSGNTEVTYDDSSGTAVIYVKSSSDIIVPNELELNSGGIPANVLLVLESSTKIEIGEESEINAFLYLVAPEIKINKEVEINGAITVDTDKLIVEVDSEFNYDISDLDDFDPHGFCNPVIPTDPLLALHRFEQTDFSTQIDDTSGNGNHAQNIFGGLSTANGKYCRGFESESWNNYNGITDAFRSSLDLDDDVGLQGTISFWFKSTINWNQGDERVLFDASRYTGLGGVIDKFFVFEIQQDGRLKFAFEDSADSKFTLVEPTLNSRTADTWYYATVTWDFTANTFAIYLDGELSTQQSRSTNGALGELIPIVFGDNSSNYTQAGYSYFPSPYSSRGDFDEVRIYNKVLSQSEIQSDMNDNNGCTSEVHHFEIDTKDQIGVTCQADEIVIKACADVSCSIRNPDAVDVVLSINNTTYKTVTVSGDSGTTTSYSHTTVGNAALSLDQTYECTNTSTTLCNVTFSDSAFLFSTIPTQISGKSSGEGVNATTLTLQAVETDNNTGACIGVFPEGGDIPVNLSYSCDDGACSQAIALTNDVNTHNVTTALASYPLRFGTDSTATLAINYPDAGKLSLNAQKDIEIEDSDGNKVIKDLSGVSNRFVERPFGFFINAVGHPTPAAVDASGSVYKKAGEDFTVELSAVVWQSTDDLNNDGVPDIGADLSNNGVTVGFGHEATPEKAKINHGLFAPASGTLGGLVSGEFTFTNGVSSDDSVSYDEVGIINLTANLSNFSYIGVSDIQGNEPYVGRFYPDHFVQTIVDGNQGNLIANHDTNPLLACSELGWVYTGQVTDSEGSIRYDNQPVLTITAYNGDGVKTLNYIEDFAKLAYLNTNVNNKITFSSPLTKHANLLPLQGDVSGIGTITVQSGGLLTYQLPSQHHYVYTRNSASKTAPFKANFELPFDEFKDSDEVTFKASSGTTDYFQNPQFYQLDAIPPEVTDFDNTVEVRFGRWLLENSYGPETSPLPVTMFTQHFDGTNFIHNDKENCLVPAVGAKDPAGEIGDGGMVLWNYRLGDLDSTDDLFPADTDASVEDVNKTFVSGIYQWLMFSAPGSNKQGSLELEYQVPPWLQYDWNNDTNFTNNPTAKLTFGIFRGNDRIIYQREIAK